MWVSSDRQPAASVYIHTLNLQLLAVLALEGKYKSRLRRTPKVFFFFFLNSSELCLLHYFTATSKTWQQLQQT